MSVSNRTLTQHSTRKEGEGGGNGKAKREAEGGRKKNELDDEVEVTFALLSPWSLSGHPEGHIVILVKLSIMHDR